MVLHSISDKNYDIARRYLGHKEKAYNLYELSTLP